MGGNVAILDSKERELPVVWENTAWLLLQGLQDKIFVQENTNTNTYTNIYTNTNTYTNTNKIVVWKILHGFFSRTCKIGFFLGKYLY